MAPARPTPDALLAPLRRLLRPLVRLLIRCGVTFPAAADLLRALYVDVAVEELGSGNRSDSRMSLLTGVHRKEIRRQRSQPPSSAPPPLVTRNGLLIATWLGARDYTDAAGMPLPLPRTAADGPSFERLVTSITQDVRPRAVLDDWLSRGIVAIDPDDRIRLLASAFLPQAGQDEQLFYFSRNLHDHVAAAAANVLAPGAAPFLDRSVHYDRLTPAAAAELERVAREAAQVVLLEVNRRAMALAEADAPPGTPTRRVNFGIYLFAADEPSAPDAPSALSAPDEPSALSALDEPPAKDEPSA
jgi:hypothetical protein